LPQDLAHRLIIGACDILDHDRVVRVGAAVTDPKVIHRHEYDAVRGVVLRLAVAGVARKAQVEVTAAVPATRQGEHDRGPRR
jgi:hypothetical protein